MTDQTPVDLTRYPISNDGAGRIALWCTDEGDPTSPLAPLPIWTEADASEQVTELVLANLVAIAEQHERKHHADELDDAHEAVDAAVRRAQAAEDRLTSARAQAAVLLRCGRWYAQHTPDGPDRNAWRYAAYCADRLLAVLAGGPDPEREPLSYGESVTSWHTVRLFDGPAIFEPDRLERQYAVEHAPECHGLPDGAVCWFDHSMRQEHRPPEWPTKVGTYRVRATVRIVGGREEPDYADILEVEPVVDSALAERVPDPLEATDAWSRAQADDDQRAFESDCREAEDQAEYLAAEARGDVSGDLGTFERLTDAPKPTSVRYMGDNLDELKQLLDGHVLVFLPPHPDDTLHTVTVQWNNGHYARIDKGMTVSYRGGNWQMDYGQPATDWSAPTGTGGE